MFDVDVQDFSSQNEFNLSVCTSGVDWNTGQSSDFQNFPPFLGGAGAVGRPSYFQNFDLKKSSLSRWCCPKYWSALGTSCSSLFFYLSTMLRRETWWLPANKHVHECSNIQLQLLKRETWWLITSNQTCSNIYLHHHIPRLAIVIVC